VNNCIHNLHRNIIHSTENWPYYPSPRIVIVYHYDFSSVSNVFRSLVFILSSLSPLSLHNGFSPAGRNNK
jgi:hypothetical protein